MGLSHLVELVSQAEREGITLAAMLSREMSPEEMELLQDELALHLSANYAKIEDFMVDVKVPSMREALEGMSDSLLDLDIAVLTALSDDEDVEEEAP